MKKVIILLLGLCFGLHAKAQGPLFIVNNIDCPVNFIVTAHPTGGSCNEYHSGTTMMTAPAMATTSLTGFNSLPNWWYPTGGVYVPGASISNPPFWDTFRFSITSDPNCVPSASLRNCGVINLSYATSCAPCPAAPGSLVYLSWVAIPPNQTYIFIDY